MSCPSRITVLPDKRPDQKEEDALVVVANGQHLAEVRCGIGSAKLSVEAPQNGASFKIDIDASVRIFL